MRTCKMTRKTAETDICLELNLDGAGRSSIDTGVGFLNHMLTLFAAHGKFDLMVVCRGDTEVDDHHSVEDMHIFRVLLTGEGERPDLTALEGALAPLCFGLTLRDRTRLPLKFSFADTELVEEFLLGFVRSCPMSLHLRQLAGKNAHHIVEGAFKGLGRALKQAVALDGSGEIPSTKGVLE